MKRSKRKSIFLLGNNRGKNADVGASQWGVEGSAVIPESLKIHIAGGHVDGGIIADGDGLYVTAICEHAF